MRLLCHRGGPHCGGTADEQRTPVAAVHVRQGDSCDRHSDTVTLTLTLALTLTLTRTLTRTLTLTLVGALLSRPMGSAPRGRLATPLEPLNLGLPRAAPAATPLEGRRRHG